MAIIQVALHICGVVGVVYSHQTAPADCVAFIDSVFSIYVKAKTALKVGHLFTVLCWNHCLPLSLWELFLGPVSAHSYLAPLLSTVLKHDCSPFLLPCWPALTLLWAQWDPCRFIIMLEKRIVTWLDFWLIWSPFVQKHPSSLFGFLDFAIQRLTFVETAEDRGGIQLYCHVHFVYMCMSNSTVPK